MKIITDKKEMSNTIDLMTTAQINCQFYENGGNKLIIVYQNEQITYINDDILNVCWFACQCNGASNKDYTNLFNKLA